MEKRNIQTDVVESRIDIRNLATMARELINSGIPPATKAEIVRLTFDFAIRVLEKNGKIKIKSTEDALGYLRKSGYIQGSREARRSTVNLLDQINIEEDTDILRGEVDDVLKDIDIEAIEKDMKEEGTDKGELK